SAGDIEGPLTSQLHPLGGRTGRRIAGRVCKGRRAEEGGAKSQSIERCRRRPVLPHPYLQQLIRLSGENGDIRTKHAEQTCREECSFKQNALGLDFQDAELELGGDPENG